jgi:hypothetical protein
MSSSPESRKRTSSITRRNLAAALAAFMAGLATRTARSDPTLSSSPHPWARCYLRGTRILTPVGPREISELQIGDLVVTHSGIARPIKWIGRRRVVRADNAAWRNSLPVKVSRFAFDEQTPSADLFLSPDHAVYLGGSLVPARCLVNGHNIVRSAILAETDVLEYFHVELAHHDVIFAEGVPAETLLPSQDRQGFDNWAQYDALYAAEPAFEQREFAPRHASGRRAEIASRLRSAFSPWVDRRRQADVIRDRIAERAERMSAAA